MKDRRISEAGFTLVEVLVVIFILSLILALVVPNYTHSAEKAQEKLCKINRENMEAQLELYAVDHGGTLPGGMTLQTLVDEKYLKELPECPGGGTYTLDTANRTVTCSKHPDGETGAGSGP